MLHLLSLRTPVLLAAVLAAPLTAQLLSGVLVVRLGD